MMLSVDLKISTDINVTKVECNWGINTDYFCRTVCRTVSYLTVALQISATAIIAPTTCVNTLAQSVAYIFRTHCILCQLPSPVGDAAIHTASLENTVWITFNKTYSLHFLHIFQFMFFPHLIVTSRSWSSLLLSLILIITHYYYHYHYQYRWLVLHYIIVFPDYPCTSTTWWWVWAEQRGTSWRRTAASHLP